LKFQLDLSITLKEKRACVQHCKSERKNAHREAESHGVRVALAGQEKPQSAAAAAIVYLLQGCFRVDVPGEIGGGIAQCVSRIARCCSGLSRRRCTTGPSWWRRRWLAMLDGAELVVVSFNVSAASPAGGVTSMGNQCVGWDKYYYFDFFFHYLRLARLPGPICAA
jgi:hypothetical protein